MSRAHSRIALLAIAGLLLAVTACWRVGPRPSSVILISIDTLRADRLGCYGHSPRTSPNLDRLASEGLVFEDASATAPWTLPSHASLLTGRYPSRVALDSKGSLSAGMPTLAEALSQRGFATAAVVNSLWLSRKFAFHLGFDQFKRVKTSEDAVGAAPSINTIAMEWLRQHKRNHLFLFLHYYDVHSDYRPLPQYQEELVPPYSGIADGTNEQLDAVRRGEVTLTEEDVRHLGALYDAEIRQLDDRLGQLFEFLRTEGLLSSTLIIVTADHGEEFLEHGSVLHGQTQYQEVLHVPLILRGPGIPRGQRIRTPVTLVDVMPTILGALRVPLPEGQDGIDLRRTWRSRNVESPDRYLFAEMDRNDVEDDTKHAVRESRYKLHYDRLTRQRQLYDLVQDPREQVDIAATHPSTVTSLFAQLEAFAAGGHQRPKATPLSPEEIEKLRSLGYVN